MRREDKVTVHAELEFATVIGLSQLLSKYLKILKSDVPTGGGYWGFLSLSGREEASSCYRTSLPH